MKNEQTKMKLVKNMVLVSGSGRNCGKTTVACNLITQLSENEFVYGLKITPHFHLTGQKQELLIEEKEGGKL